MHTDTLDATSLFTPRVILLRRSFDRRGPKRIGYKIRSRQRFISSIAKIRNGTMKEEISFSGFFFGGRESGETTKFYNDFSAFKVSMLDKISSIDSFPWRNIGSSRGTNLRVIRSNSMFHFKKSNVEAMVAIIRACVGRKETGSKWMAGN